MRRVRKAQALFVALVVMTGILATAVPAFAAPSSTARLTVGQQVFPGSNRPFSIQVTNSGLPIAGETINAVRVLLPTQTAGLRNGSGSISGPGSWTATRVSQGNLQSILFKGGTIAPGANATFTFPSDIDAPAAGDRSGTFQVQVSSDGGATSSATTVPAGASLNTLVKVLEVTSVMPTSPAGVVDGTGTAGQAVTIASQVKNYAANSVAVDPALTASGGAETITDQGPTNIGPGATVTFNFPVLLGAAGADRTVSLTGQASATGATAVEKSSNLVVQAAPSLSPQLGTLSPRTVRAASGSPIEYTFTINTQKAGTPALNLTSGSLSFAGNTIGLQGSPSFGAGPGTQTLSFGPASITGVDGAYDAVLQFTGVDANGKEYAQTVTLADAITIDGIAPSITAILSLPNDEDGDAQTAAKNGDEITVEGSVSDNLSATIDFVELRSDAGDVINVPVTVTNGEYTGSVDASFSQGATSFLAAAQATDAAGNRGTVESTPALIDLLAPILVNPGEVLNTTTIRVRFDDAVGLVKGGCSTSEWEVDGSLVTDVQFSDGTSCRPGLTSATPQGVDNYRVLVLAQAIDETEEPAVTYTPGNPLFADRAKDGAGNFTVSTLIDTVSQVAPLAPDILSVTRDGGTETATFNDDRYWTRFGGNDLQVNFAGARSGYRIQVLDGNDQVLYTSDPLAGSTGTVAIPIGTTEGNYGRKIRLLSSRAVPGATTPLTIALDTTAPAISNSAVATASDAAADQIAVTLSEPLAGGTNFSFDWYAYEMAGSERAYYVVDRVTGTGNTLTVEATLPNVTVADSSAFGGVDYIFTSGDSGGTRYVDRAGNALGDTTAF